MTRFTLDQKKAHDPNRHISITANAGSGKTRVLVSRYCDIVEHFGAMPGDIAAITFTEKAASELRGKIAEEFERRLGSDQHRASWWLLKTAREKFPSAIVSTIHGFCSQLLREFPIETGVAPNYAVISGYERRRMSEDTLMEAIEHALAESGGAEFERTFDLARRLGREKMEHILRMMLGRREIITFSRMGGVLALERDETLERWRTRLDAVVRGMLLNADTIPAFSRLIEMMKDDKAAEAGAVFSDLRAARSADEIITRANALRELLLTKEGTPRKRSYRLSGEEFEVLEDPAMKLAAAFRRAGKFLEASGDPDLHGQLFDDTRLLLNVYDDAMRRYAARKDRLNVLDFEDLQLRLLEGLRQPGNHEKMARRFRHIMIDEFQDTNELQYSIARDLLEGLGFGHLCIVGDRKQSIYGFRNAEVEVFTKATEEIRVSNRAQGRDDGPLFFRSERIEPESREEAQGVINLNASFRLLPSICAYVNASCRPIIGRSASSMFGVEYDDLVCARRSAGRGTVEIILQSPEQESDDGADRYDPIWCPEAEMIARRLLGIVARGEPVVWECPAGEEEESARPARFSDMAILSRKRTHFPAIEAAFRKYGVPFVTHGGVGFYKTQEIHDLLNYLRTLLNSRDDIALLGLLRSPFFCVSDADLYRLTLTRDPAVEENDLWSRAVRHAASGTADEPLRRAVEMIADDRCMASRIPISLLLRRLLERTGWRGAVIGAERGEQNLANVDKMIEMAREYESRGFTNLFDFVERVSEMVELEEMEGEAPVNTGRDAVRLMTMHAAKGLEFPIVVLPALHSPTRISAEPFFDKDLGFGWNWKYNKEEHRPAIVALMGLRESERERAEEARLFYVAATRARDLLILSGEYDRRKPPVGTMLDWAIAPFSFLPEESGPVRLFAQSLRFLDADGATERTEAWEQSVDFHLAIDELPRYSPFGDTTRPFRADAVRIGELRARVEGEIYSATQLLIYTQCPTKYYLKYRLGIPEKIAEAYDIDPDSRDSEDGTIFARLFRRAAIRIDQAIPGSASALPLLATDAGDPDERTAIERIIDDALRLEPLAPEDLVRMRRMLLETFGRLLSSPIAGAILFPPDSRPRTDYELRMPFESEYLLGVIDRVVEMEDGTLSLVQYKTRRLDRTELHDAAEGYLPQLRAYAYLIAALNPAQRSVQGTVLFTEHPDEPQSFVFSRFETTRIEEEIRAAIGDIRALSFSGRRELPLRTPHCPECPYWIEKTCLLARAGESGVC
ncbi:MAG: UvrD-helicase domain-containing protein [Candidatus Kapaibacterium sp.]